MKLISDNYEEEPLHPQHHPHHSHHLHPSNMHQSNMHQSNMHPSNMHHRSLPRASPHANHRPHMDQLQDDEEGIWA